MSDARNAWIGVADKVESLGRKLKHHLEEEGAGADRGQAEADAQNAFEEMSDKVRDAFDAFGAASRDDAVRDDVRDIADLIKDALIETFQAVGSELGDLFERLEDYAEDAAERVSDAVRGSGDDEADGEVEPIVLDSDQQDGTSVDDEAE